MGRNFKVELAGTLALIAALGATGCMPSLSGVAKGGNLDLGVRTAPVGASGNGGASLIANNAAGIIANNAGGLVGNATGPSASLIANNAAGIIANNAGGLVANNAAGILANNAGGLISNNSGGLVSNNSAGFHVLASGDSVVAAGAEIVVFDERNRQISEGTVKTDAEGNFRFDKLKPSGPIVFIRATLERGGRKMTLMSSARAPRAAGDIQVGITPATSLVAKKTLAMVARGGFGGEALKSDTLEALAKRMAPVMTDRALVAAVMLEESQAAGTFDAMLQESPALNDALAAVAAPGAADRLLAKTPGVSANTANTSANQVATLAGGEAGMTNGSAAETRFNGPSGVAADKAGNLFVADTDNHRIRRIAPDGTVTTFAGADTAGSADGSGTAASFNAPAGLAFSADGTLYVADAGNHRIRTISATGEVDTLVGGDAGFADGASGVARFKTPWGIGIGPDGTLFVADAGNQRIRKVTPAGAVTTVAGSGEPGYADGAGSAARFSGPRAVCVAADGTLYVADSGNHRIRSITPAGVVATLAGDGTRGDLDGGGAKARFNSPSGLALSPEGRLYVADAGNYRVRAVSLATGEEASVSKYAGSGKSGWVDGGGEAAQFGLIQGIALFGDGRLAIADRTNNRIRVVR